MDVYFFFTGSLRNADLMSDSENISALATPSRTQRRMDPRRRRLKLFRKKTFLVNDANKSNENGTTLGSSDGNDNDNGIVMDRVYPGFGFYKYCRGEMGLKGKLSKVFLHFFAKYLMIFQSLAVTSACCTLKNHQIYAQNLEK